MKYLILIVLFALCTTLSMAQKGSAITKQLQKRQLEAKAAEAEKKAKAKDAGDSKKQVNLTKTISAVLPNEFAQLSKENIRQRYITTNKIIAAYGVPNTPTDFTFAIAKPVWGGDKEKDVAVLFDTYKANIRSLYNKVVFLSEGKHKVSGKNAVWFEFISSSGNSKSNTNTNKNSAVITRYTFIEYVVHRNRILTFTFTASSKEDATWRPVAAEIIKSIKINKK